MAHDYLAPRFQIKVEDTSLENDILRYVTGVEYVEQEDSASKIVLHITNKELRFSESRLFAEGNHIELWMGYGNKLKFMNRCQIVKPNPMYPRDSLPQLNVVAYDLSHKLMGNEKDFKGKVYRKKKDSEIASAIFKKYFITPDVVDTKKIISTRVHKKAMNPWEFLKKMAKINDYVINVRYDIEAKKFLGYFGPSEIEKQEMVYDLAWGEGEIDSVLFEFYPDISIPSQTTDLEMVYTDFRTKKTKKIKIQIDKKKAEDTLYKAYNGKEKLKVFFNNGPSIAFNIYGQRLKSVQGPTFKSVKDAKRYAAMWFTRMQEEFIIAEGTCLGIPDLRMGQTHDFNGLGSRFNGEYHITSVRHTMTPGNIYEVDFTARKVIQDSFLGTKNNLSKVKQDEVEL